MLSPKEAAMSIDIKLDLWIKNNENVLLVGKHGVGKTAMVKQAFERNGVKWKYFSASTMDPWVDFVGIPKECTATIKGEEKSYIRMIKPLEFVLGEVEAIFFDEFNRSPKKIRNAVLELIQFKSVNGDVFPNLRMVWAAVNPDDDSQEYDVERMDQAQLDRFQVHRTIEYKPDIDYFRSKFGSQQADSAVCWWNQLDDHTKGMVSPRRLDYALTGYSKGGDLRDYLPQECGVSKLLHSLKEGPTTGKLAAFMSGNDKDGARKWLRNENNFASATKFICESKTLMEWFSPLLPKEKIISLMHSSEKFRKHVINSSGSEPVFSGVCQHILSANGDSQMSVKIKRHLTQHPELAKSISEAIQEAKK